MSEKEKMFVTSIVLQFSKASILKVVNPVPHNPDF